MVGLLDLLDLLLMFFGLLVVFSFSVVCHCCVLCMFVFIIVDCAC